MRYKYKFDPDPFNTHMLLINEVPVASKVLEIGSASGYMGDYLFQEKKCELWGVEPFCENLEKETEVKYNKFFKITVEELVNSKLAPLAYFDVIFIADVLEHLVSPEEALTKLKKYLKEDGIFVISLPNIAHYSIRWSLLRGRFDMQDAGILDRTHLKFYTKESAVKMFESLGFKIIKVRPSGGYLERFGKRKLFKIGKKVLFAFPNLFSFQFIFVIKI